MKKHLPFAIVVSVLIHVFLLVLLTHNSPVKPQKAIEKVKPVIKAVMIYRAKPEPKPEPQKAPEPKPKLESKPEPVVKSQIAKAIEKTTQKTIEKTTVTLQPPTPSKPVDKTIDKPVNEKVIGDKKPQGSFDSDGGMSKLIQSQNEEYLQTLNYTDQPAQVTPSVNSANDPVNQPLFERSSIIDADTRVIKYGNGCMQIKRTVDYNGFTKNSWSGSSIPCGQDDDGKAQLKKSLNKLLKPKKVLNEINNEDILLTHCL
jgi:outer membrane biosynthesis protein TonB